MEVPYRIRLRRLSAFFIVLCLVISLLPAGADEVKSIGQWRVTGDDGVNLREEGNVEAKKLLTIPKNAVVDVTETSKNWGKTTYNNVTGWFCLTYATYLSASEPVVAGWEETTVSPSKSLVTNASVNLRAGPGTTYKSYTIVAVNSTVEVIATAGSWSKVIYGGYIGYISSGYLSEYSGTLSCGKYKISSASAVLHEKASSSSSQVAKLYCNTVVTITAVNGIWGKTTVNGTTGWLIATDLVTYSGTVTDTGDDRVDILEIARNELGNTDGTKYTGGDDVAWCAYFVGWCARKAGVSTSVIRTHGLARPYAQVDIYYSADDYLPSPGDLVYFDWPGTSGDSNHIGFVETVVLNDAGTEVIRLVTIEGNSSNAVSRKTYTNNGTNAYNSLSSVSYYGVPQYVTDNDSPKSLKAVVSGNTVTFTWTGSAESYDIYILPAEETTDGLGDISKAVFKMRTSAKRLEIGTLTQGSYTAQLYSRPGSTGSRSTASPVSFTLGTTVKVKTVTLKANSLTLAVGDTVSLETQITPTNASNQSVVYKSSDTSVLTVNSSGKLTALAPGKATVTATASDGSGVKASLTFTVSAAVNSTEDASYVTLTGVNMRESPSASATLLGTIPKGTTLKVTSVSGAWGKTTYKNKTGWFCLNYAQLSGNTEETSEESADATNTVTNEPTSTVWRITSSSGVNLRKGPGTGYAKLTVLANKRQVTVTEEKDGWGKTTVDGKTGWFLLTYAEKVAAQNNSTDTENGTGSSEESTTADNDTDISSTTSQKYKVTASSGLNLRKTASSSGTKLTTLPKNTVITVTQVQDGWGKTTYAGKTGWVSLSYCEKVTASTTEDKKYKITYGVNLRSAAGTSGAVLTTIPKGTKVTVTEVKNNWGKTTYGGKTGWFCLKYAEMS